jgi:hypothetical protein
MTEYNVTLNNVDHFIVDATVFKIPNTQRSIECEVEIHKIKKFDEFLEEYVKHEPSDDELVAIQKQIAVKFFNRLH